MKRLIKSELHGKFQKFGKYYKVFQNPTTKEIEDTKKKDFSNCIAGVITSDGDIFIWPSEIGHHAINNYLENKINIDGFRFVTDVNRWLLDAHEKYTVDEMKKMVLKYQNILSQFGDINLEFLFYFFLSSNNKDNVNYDGSVSFFIRDIESSKDNKTAKQQDVEIEIGDNIQLKRHPYDKSIYEVKEILPDGTLFLDNGIAALTNIKPSVVKKIN